MRKRHCAIRGKQVKKLFTDNRTAGILRILGTKSGLTVAVIAEQLGVSERTIRNDIRQLNEDLEEVLRLKASRDVTASGFSIRPNIRKYLNGSATRTDFSIRRAAVRTMYSGN